MTEEIIELEAEEIQYPVMASEPTIVHIGGMETTSPDVILISEPIAIKSRLEKVICGYRSIRSTIKLE